MARERWEYNTFTHNLIRRKGLYYQKQITTFINSIYNAEDEVSGVEIYLVYRLEADIKSVLYKYIQNIEHSIIAAIESRNPNLKNSGHLHKALFSELIRIIKGKETTTSIDEFQFKLSKENSKKALYYLSTLNMFKDGLEFQDFDSKLISFRNEIQHFNWLFSKNLTKSISNFNKLLSFDFQTTLKLNIMSIYLRTFSYFGVSISKPIWKYIKKVFKISKRNKIIKLFIEKYEIISIQDLQGKNWFLPRLELSKDIEEYIREYIFNQTINFNLSKAYSYYEKDKGCISNKPSNKFLDGYNKWKKENELNQNRNQSINTILKSLDNPIINSLVKDKISNFNIDAYNVEELINIAKMLRNTIDETENIKSNEALRRKTKYLKRTAKAIKKPKHKKTKDKKIIKSNTFAINLNFNISDSNAIKKPKSKKEN